MAPHRVSLAFGFVFALSGCAGKEPEERASQPTYERVAEIVRTSCTFETSCHGGSGNGKARLNFARLFAAGAPLQEALVGVAACEYDRMPRVDPGHPENSWLWIKIASAHDADGRIQFNPSPEWNPELARDSQGRLRASTCPLVVDGELGFGEIMPQTSMTGLPEDSVRAIRDWIAAGAPGPMGSDAGVPDGAND